MAFSTEGAASGAAAGSSFGPWGAAIGGVVGGVAGGSGGSGGSGGGGVVPDMSTTTISQGGLNVPAYPDFYNLAPIDADSVQPIVSRQDKPVIYAAMGMLFFLALLKRKK